MIFFDHFRSFALRHLRLQVPLVSDQGSLLCDSSFRGEVDSIEEALDIANPPLQLIDRKDNTVLSGSWGTLLRDTMALAQVRFLCRRSIFRQFAIFTLRRHEIYRSCKSANIDG